MVRRGRERSPIKAWLVNKVLDASGEKTAKKHLSAEPREVRITRDISVP